MTGDPETLLRTGLATLGLDPDSQPCRSYLAYTELLMRWNRAYSLTAVRGTENILSRHVLDALSILPFVHGGRCLDVGSGAGVPGLILALADPARYWVLLDSNLKKTRFLTQAVIELGIPNAEVMRARVEQYETDTGFTTITSRAFASLTQFHEQTRHLLARDGALLAMKGPVTTELEAEIAELAGQDTVVQVHELAVPGVDGRRSLVEVRQSDGR